jgi:alkylation response protein AidB-like acyl-CoA dehydrogenase
MRFAFDPEQREFAAALRDYLEKACTPEQVRAGFSRDRWLALAEMGVVGMTAPSERGGMGLDEVGLVLLLEEAGRACLPESIGESAAVPLSLLSSVGAEGDLIERVADGTSVMATGIDGAPHIRQAGVADVLLLRDGDQIHVVKRESADLDPRSSVDPTRPLFTVSWRPTDGSRVAAGAGSHLQAAFDRGALAASAELVGLAARMIEMGADYAKQREQFGRPIGSFQAVKHLLATALVRVEFARPVVYRAAWSVANDVPERSRDVSMAKAFASEAALIAARASLQVHGAIGYTEEHDLHLWLKRTRALGSAWGTAAWHRDRVAASALAAVPAS